jgi:hypothetical protein
MAKQVLTDVVVTLNGTAISQSVNSVELSLTADAIETTSFGDAGFRTYKGGLKSGSITLSMHNDYASTALDSVLFGLFNTIATVTVSPAGTPVGTSTPAYSLTCLVDNVSPVSGAVGDLAVQNLTWTVTGAITRGTSAL